MEIKWKNLDFSSESLYLENIIDFKINGVKIQQIENGLQISTDKQIRIIPIASNMVEVLENKPDQTK